MRRTVGPLVATRAAPGVVEQLDRQPAFVVETGFVPAGHLQPGVVGFAHQQVVFQQRAEPVFPGAVRGDGDRAAVCQGDLQLGQQPGPVDVLLAVIPADVPDSPAIAQDGAERRCRRGAAERSRRRPGTARACGSRSSPGTDVVAYRLAVDRCTRTGRAPSRTGGRLSTPAGSGRFCAGTARGCCCAGRRQRRRRSIFAFQSSRFSSPISNQAGSLGAGAGLVPYRDVPVHPLARRERPGRRRPRAPTGLTRPCRCPTGRPSPPAERAGLPAARMR